MSDLLQATDPESCGYVVTVVWLDGTRSVYEGSNVTAETLPSWLRGVAAEIEGHLQPAGESETA